MSLPSKSRLKIPIFSRKIYTPNLWNAPTSCPKRRENPHRKKTHSASQHRYLGAIWLSWKKAWRSYANHKGNGLFSNLMVADPTVDERNPEPIVGSSLQGLYVPGGAGFLPSTVWWIAGFKINPSPTFRLYLISWNLYLALFDNTLILYKSIKGKKHKHINLLLVFLCAKNAAPPLWRM